MLGLCFVILLDSWDTSITTWEEIDELAPIPALGSVPLVKNLNGSKNRKPHSLQSADGVERAALAPARETTTPARRTHLPFELRESMGSICASILLSRSDERPRVIVVTSATHAEGKTTVVSHLGRAFAEAGSKTLLIEADLRKPDLSKTFAIDGQMVWSDENGLSLYLAGLVSTLPRIHETDTPNLFLAPGGPVPPNPAALLHSERLGDFLAAASSEYQIVILDAPPLLAMADARILASKVDGVVLVVRAGQTAKKLVRRSFAMLEQSGANVLGMVLNGWQPTRAELSHYRYYQPPA
jgi:capsular exopolysaccharide synthesis family protein